MRAAAYNQPDLLHASTECTAAMQVGYRNLSVGLLQRFGMRMVVPYTVNQLIEGSSALVDGFGLEASSGEPHPTLQIADQHAERDAINRSSGPMLERHSGTACGYTWYRAASSPSVSRSPLTDGADAPGRR